MRLLVVEDDERSASYLVRGLAESGHVVDRAADGEAGLALACEGIYDVVIVDRRLPGLDGIALVKHLRAAGHDMPALMLSAVAGMRDRVEGMRAGCDDYLAKPYAFAELLARIEALARRVDRARHQALLGVGDLRFDPAGRRATRGQREIPLQHRECLLLELLMRHADQVVTRSMLFQAGWGYDLEPQGNFIDRHIYRLRQKIDQGHPEPLIRTVRGAGYMISTAGEDHPERNRP
jgi:two-component system OmpR family response regulator